MYNLFYFLRNSKFENFTIIFQTLDHRLPVASLILENATPSAGPSEFWFFSRPSELAAIFKQNSTAKFKEKTVDYSMIETSKKESASFTYEGEEGTSKNLQ